MKTIEKLSLGELVIQAPKTATILEKYSLDFCCKGKQTLDEAMKDSSNEKAAIIEELKSVLLSKSKPEIQFDSIKLSALVDRIINNHHIYAKEALIVIGNHLQKVTTKHGEKNQYLKQIEDAFRKLKNEMEQHMMKEEAILFPRIKRMETLSAINLESDLLIDAPIHVMETEHETAGNLLSMIKQLANHYSPPYEACTTWKVVYNELKHFEHDLHTHVHLENNILFPRALALQSKILQNSLN